MSGWKLCKDVLPKIDGFYIVSGKMKYPWEDYEYFVDVAEYHQPDPLTLNQGWETWNDWYEGQEEYEIVAWQELPEPYKEDQDDN